MIIATNGAEGAIVMDGFGGCESRWVGRKWRKRARDHLHEAIHEGNIPVELELW